MNEMKPKRKYSQHPPELESYIEFYVREQTRKGGYIFHTLGVCKEGEVSPFRAELRAAYPTTTFSTRPRWVYRCSDGRLRFINVTPLEEFQHEPESETHASVDESQPTDAAAVPGPEGTGVGVGGTDGQEFRDEVESYRAAWGEVRG